MNDISSASLFVVRCLSIQALNFSKNNPCKEAIFTVHHRAPPLSKTGNNISISTLQILLKVVTFAQASK